MALPKVSVQAVLILKDFERSKKQYEKSLDDMVRKTEQASKGVQKATKGMTTSFDEFTKKSAEMQKAVADLVPQASIKQFQDLRIQFGELAKGTEINIDKFDELRAGGESFADAFAGATSGAADAAAGLSKVAIAATAVSVAIGATIKLIRESVAAYEELGREVRLVSLELGVSAREASGWVAAADRAGVSSSTFNRAMTQLSRNILNYRIAQLQGKEETNNFAKALAAFDIEVTKADDSLKSATEIFIELQQAAQESGPGVATFGALSNALGFSTRQLTLLLLDESLALDAVQQRADFFGKTLGELDKEQTKSLTAATNDLKDAWAGFGNLISRIFGPAVEQWKKGMAEIINSVRILIAVGVAAQNTINALAHGTIQWAEANEYFLEQQAIFILGTTAAAEEAARLKREQDELAQQGLVTAAAQEDLTDALDEQEKVMERLTNAWEKYQDRIADIGRRFDDQLEDAGIRESRDRLRRNLELSFKLEDIHIKRNRRLRELEFKWVNDLDNIQRDAEKKVIDFARDAARAREKIAVKHRENLLKIENTFNDTVEEAARTNDTVAVVRAIRTRNRQQRDETRRFSVEQQELEKDLKIKRDKIREDAERRKTDLINDDAERRAIIERQFQDEIDDLIRKNSRELALSRNKDRERREDIERNRSRALRDAQIFYDRERMDLQAHLDELRIITGTAIQGFAVDAARFVWQGVNLIADTAATAMVGAAAGIMAGMVGGGGGSQFTPGVPPLPPQTGSAIDAWRRASGANYRAHGGLDVVNSPTTFVAGEAGAEIAAFIPLSQSRNINHSFGKLPIDFQGLPGGMDTGQVEKIVYSAMIELARTLGASQRRG